MDFANLVNYASQKSLMQNQALAEQKCKQIPSVIRTKEQFTY
jgi:hypothetical protein